MIVALVDAGRADLAEVGPLAAHSRGGIRLRSVAARTETLSILLGHGHALGGGMVVAGAAFASLLDQRGNAVVVLNLYPDVGASRPLPDR
ncbi:hypothetical protein ACVBEG_26735 [Pseudomonas sp. GG8]